MPKSKGLPSLNLNATRGTDGRPGFSTASLTPKSPGSPNYPESVPGSPFVPDSTPQLQIHVTSTSPVINGTHQPASPTSPRITAMPELPPSPKKTPPKHGREPSKFIFSNLLASKSSHKLQLHEPSITEGTEKNGRSRGSSRDRSQHTLRKQASASDMLKMVGVNGEHNIAAGGLHEGTQMNSSAQDTVNSPATPQMQLDHAAGPTSSTKKPKSRLGGMLTRTRTLRLDEAGKQSKLNSPTNLTIETKSPTEERIDPAVKTAPIRSEFRDASFPSDGPLQRNRSADRHIPGERPGSKKDRSGSSVQALHPFKDSSGPSSLLSNIHQTGRGVGDRLGRAGKGFFGRITRSGSSTERDVVTDDNYVCSTINLPLIKQTRKTRIAKSLASSKDKTEYWLPALPWRCIDYLNMNGCEEEGLYRIPGSGRDVKHWQRRFDTEMDINLFDEPDLHDINTISSMFKAWLRDLPDDLMPKSVQSMIATQCAGAVETPQLLKDELSKLPPFNYYLLFAITSHLNLLHSFADKNKMDFRNLCICFQPCLRIDSFCFQFLVLKWKTCWQGCWTEKEFFEEELRHEREGSLDNIDEAVVEDRSISTSGSNYLQAPHENGADPKTSRKATITGPKRRSQSNPVEMTSRPLNDSLTTRSKPIDIRRVQTPEPPKTSSSAQLPEIKGLSPIMF